MYWNGFMIGIQNYESTVFIFREIWLNGYVCRSATKGGHLNLLQWFRQLGSINLKNLEQNHKTP